MHAYGLENLLQPIENAKNEGRVPQILDVGCGSGYLLGKVFHGSLLAFYKKNIFSTYLRKSFPKRFKEYF